mgnify:CR=1 FL=1
MSFTWGGDGPAPPLPQPGGIAAWLRIARRAALLAALLVAGALATLLLRLVERPLGGLRRPVTPHITQGVCRAALAILGIGHGIRGRPIQGPGAVVANHASWLDIFALNAHQRVCFVSKSEVARWPGIGLLARITGTVFIDRDRRQVVAQAALFAHRLAGGQRLLFFPEGTSSDGMRVLRFRPTLFQAFMAPDLRGTLRVQPVTVVYQAPPGADRRFYGWWGDMEFAAHLLQVLAAPRQGRVEVIYHPPLRAADFADRKALAAAAEVAVRQGMPESRR